MRNPRSKRYFRFQGWELIGLGVVWIIAMAGTGAIAAAPFGLLIVAGGLVMVRRFAASPEDANYRESPEEVERRKRLRGPAMAAITALVAGQVCRFMHAPVGITLTLYVVAAVFVVWTVAMSRHS